MYFLSANGYQLITGRAQETQPHVFICTFALILSATSGSSDPDSTYTRLFNVNVILWYCGFKILLLLLVICVSALETVPTGPLYTYHGSCMSECPGGQRTGTRSGADAVRVPYADSWPSHDGRRGAAGCRFDSLLQGLCQGLLTIQQRQPQGREALLLTGRGRSEFMLTDMHDKHRAGPQQQMLLRLLANLA